MLAQCLMKNPVDRPTAERLLAHRFFARRAARDAPALVTGLLLRLAPRGAGSGRRSGSGLGLGRQRSGRAQASWGSEADLQRLAGSGSGSGSRSGASSDWMGACVCRCSARLHICSHACPPAIYVLRMAVPVMMTPIWDNSLEHGGASCLSWRPSSVGQGKLQPS